MTDYTDVQEALQRAARQDPRAAAMAELQARAHRHAAERLGRLLVLDEWGSYKALVQERIEQAEAALAQARDAIETAVGEEREKKALQIQRLRGQIDAYRDALTFPDKVVQDAPAEEAAPSRA